MDNDLGVRKTVMLNKVYEELLSVTKGVSSYKMCIRDRKIISIEKAE